MSKVATVNTPYILVLGQKCSLAGPNVSRLVTKMEYLNAPRRECGSFGGLAGFGGIFG